jgi:hypothetical protein
VPLYVTRDLFCKQLGIVDQTNISVFLVNEKGQILWQTATFPNDDAVSEMFEIFDTAYTTQALSELNADEEE